MGPSRFSNTNTAFCVVLEYDDGTAACSNRYVAHSFLFFCLSSLSRSGAALSLAPEASLVSTRFDIKRPLMSQTNTFVALCTVTMPAMALLLSMIAERECRDRCTQR